MQWVAEVGTATGRTVAYAGALAEISAKSLRLLFLSPLKRSRMFQRAIHEAMAVGVGAIPIVSLIPFFIGVILALQGAYELQRLGAMRLVAGLVSVAITRELGPLITAIVVIGRSGSAFAAEIGTMRVIEELDALQTMALDPVAFLVVPKFLAMAVMLPCLAICADLMEVLGDQASIQAKISLRVELVDRKTNQNVWDYTAAREEPVSGKSVPDVVQSLERNLHHVVTEIAGELDKFLSARW
jgi:ABC transport permease subunit